MNKSKILIIDDKLDNLISFKAVVKNSAVECELLSALSGKEGVEMARKHLPDIIVLDINMPGMDGFEVCKVLKTNSDLKHIPIVLLTAKYDDSESRIKGLELGADAFLTKPISDGELIAQINVMLRIKYAEDRLRNEKHDLEKIVRERTKELEMHRNQLEAIVNQRTQELEAKNEELESFNKLFVGRELRIVELKRKLEEYEREISVLKGKENNSGK